MLKTLRPIIKNVKKRVFYEINKNVKKRWIKNVVDENVSENLERQNYNQNLPI